MDGRCPEEEWAVRAHLVQLLQQRRAPLTQLERFVAEDPHPSGSRLARDLGDPVEERFDRRVRLVPNVRRASLEGGHTVVVVGIDEPGEDGAASEVDHLRLLSDGATDMIEAADGDDRLAIHRDRLRRRRRGIHRQHHALQDERSLAACHSHPARWPLSWASLSAPAAGV